MTVKLRIIGFLLIALSMPIASQVVTPDIAHPDSVYAQISGNVFYTPEDAAFAFDLSPAAILTEIRNSNRLLLGAVGLPVSIGSTGRPVESPFAIGYIRGTAHRPWALRIVAGHQAAPATGADNAVTYDSPQNKTLLGPNNSATTYMWYADKEEIVFRQSESTTTTAQLSATLPTGPVRIGFFGLIESTRGLPGSPDEYARDNTDTYNTVYIDTAEATEEPSVVIEDVSVLSDRREVFDLSARFEVPVSIEQENGVRHNGSIAAETTFQNDLATMDRSFMPGTIDEIRTYTTSELDDELHSTEVAIAGSYELIVPVRDSTPRYDGDTRLTVGASATRVSGPRRSKHELQQGYSVVPTTDDLSVTAVHSEIRSQETSSTVHYNWSIRTEVGRSAFVRAGALAIGFAPVAVSSFASRRPWEAISGSTTLETRIDENGDADTVDSVDTVTIVTETYSDGGIPVVHRLAFEALLPVAFVIDPVALFSQKPSPVRLLAGAQLTLAGATMWTPKWSVTCTEIAQVENGTGDQISESEQVPYVVAQGGSSAVATTLDTRITYSIGVTADLGPSARLDVGLAAAPSLQIERLTVQTTLELP